MTFETNLAIERRRRRRLAREYRSRLLSGVQVALTIAAAAMLLAQAGCI